MGPVSAVAVSFFLVLYGLAGVAWITASPKVLGTIAILAAAVVLVDTFYHWFADRRA